MKFHEEPPSIMSPKGGRWLLACCVIVDAGVLWLVFVTNALASCGDVPRMSVDQFVHSQERLSGQEVRVTGFLVKGSVVRIGQGCSTRFSLQDQGVVLHVRYTPCAWSEIPTCSKPIDVPMTVQGRAHDSVEFEASAIFMMTYLLLGRC